MVVETPVDMVFPVVFGAVLGPMCGRGLHSSTFRLNVSAFCGIGGVSRGCLVGVRGF
jgi:hypothetical protein